MLLRAPWVPSGDSGVQRQRLRRGIHLTHLEVPVSHEVHQAVHVQPLPSHVARHLERPHQGAVWAGDELSCVRQQVGPPVPEGQAPLLLASEVLQQQDRLLLRVEGEDLGLGKPLLYGFAQFLPAVQLLL